MTSKLNSRDRRHDMIYTAARLFREKGYAVTSIRDISDGLNITSAALYYHFKNKEELLLAVMQVSLAELKEKVERAVAQHSDPWERIRSALRSHLRASLEYQDFAIVLLKDLRHLSGAPLETVIEARDAYEKFWGQLLSDAQEKQYIRADVNLNLLRLLTFGAMNLVVTWYKPTGVYRPDEIADAFLEYIGQGVIEGSHLALANGLLPKQER